MSYMTAESRVEWLPHGRDFTRADLDAMPDDGNRYELVDGAIIVTPAPHLPHQVVITQMWLCLYQACPVDMRALVAPFDVTLSEDTVVQPDVLVAARSDFDDRSLKGSPLLVVEVLSPSTRHLDLAFKRARYEAARCRRIGSSIRLSRRSFVGNCAMTGMRRLRELSDARRSHLHRHFRSPLHRGRADRLDPLTVRGSQRRSQLFGVQ